MKNRISPEMHNNLNRGSSIYRKPLRASLGQTVLGRWRDNKELFSHDAPKVELSGGTESFKLDLRDRFAFVIPFGFAYPRRMDLRTPCKMLCCQEISSAIFSCSLYRSSIPFLLRVQMGLQQSYNHF